MISMLKLYERDISNYYGVGYKNVCKNIYCVDDPHFLCSINFYSLRQQGKMTTTTRNYARSVATVFYNLSN